MKKRFIIIAILLTSFAHAQNVGINSTGATPDASAMLDVDAAPSNDKGLLIPRVALLAANSALPITSPATSLIVYNTATAGISPNNVVPGFYYWDSAKWVPFAGSSDAYGKAWKTSSYLLGAVATWFPITLDAGDANLVNVTHSTSINPERLTVLVAGTYEVSYGLNLLNVSGTGLTPCARLNVNGISPVIGSDHCTTIGGVNAQNITSTTIVSLSVNDYIQLEARDDVANVVNVAPRVTYIETSAQVSIRRIGN